VTHFIQPKKLLTVLKKMAPTYKLQTILTANTHSKVTLCLTKYHAMKTYR